MKSLLEENKEILKTTHVSNFSELSSKENNYLFNSTDRLAADHDVKVSNTMIKVTYKKPWKDYCASAYKDLINFNKELVLNENNMNSSLNPAEVWSKKDDVPTEKNDIVIVATKTPIKGGSESTWHSNFKKGGEELSIKKRENMNGLVSDSVSDSKKKNVVGNSNDCRFLTDSGVSSGSIKSSQKSSGKKNEKIQANYRFLNSVSVVKIKNNISKNKKSEKLKVSVDNCSLKKKQKVDNVIKKKRNITDVVDKKSRVVKKRTSSSAVKVEERPKIVKCERSQKDERNKKKPILLVDPELPTGWTRYIRTRNKGSPDEKPIVYVVSPQGTKFRFKWKLRKYLEKINSPLDADQFFFGLYKRTKPINVPGAREENKKQIRSSSNSNLFSEKKQGYGGNLSVKKCSNSGKKLYNSTLDDESEEESASDTNKTGKFGNSEHRELLLHDPDLPFGWKRIINSNNSNGKLQVHIISPEGRIFRRRYRLSEYLAKHQYTHSMDRFYFGLYPKKDTSSSETKISNSEDNVENDRSKKTKQDAEMDEDDESDSMPENEESLKFKKDIIQLGEDGAPMYDDPNLPEGWRRFIKIRTLGESAGRMEVIIVSPDGKKHRSKGQLERYIHENRLNYDPNDFDFTVFGRPKKRQAELESKESLIRPQTKFKSEKPVPSLDYKRLKVEKVTPEGAMINAVKGWMIACGLSSARNQRRNRLPKKEQEDILKKYLESEGENNSENGCEIPTSWIQRLVKCKSEIRNLESDAVSTIADKTKDFIQEMCRRALESSQTPEEGLNYNDIAELVEKYDSLSSLKTLIPKKITYKEYIKLNRPKQFFSFT